MSMQKKRALLECGCGCGDNACPGCCFPMNEAETEFLPIDFCIDAPACPSVDGVCGVFTDLAIEVQNKVCGSCGTFEWIGGNLAIDSISYNPDGEGNCFEEVGQGLNIKFMLYCDAEMGVPDDTSDNICCRRLRLICGTDYETVGRDLSIVLPDLGQYITVIEPASCSCDPLAVTFNLGRLAPMPQENPAPECPFAPGFQIPACDLSAIDLVI